MPEDGIQFKFKLVGADLVARGMGKIKGAMGGLQNSTMRLTSGLLGVMFVGMALNRMFGGLWKSMRKFGIEQAFAVIQMSLMTSVMASPIFSSFIDIIWKLTDVFLGLPEPVKQFLGIGQVLISWIGTVLQWFGSLGLGLIGFAKIWPFIQGTIAAVVGGISTSVLLIIAAIAAVIVIGVLLVKNWDTIKAKLVELWEKFKQTDFFKTVSEIWGKVRDVIMKVWDAISPYIINGLKFLKDIWDTTWNFIKGVISVVWNNVIKPVAELIIAIMQKIAEKIRDFLKPIWDTVWGAIKDTFQWVGEKIEWIWDNLIKPPLDSFMDILDKIKETYDRTLGKILEKLKGGTQVFKFVVEEITKRVKSYQHGGLIRETGLAYVHKGEYVMPKGKTGGIVYSPNISIQATISSGFDIDDLVREINSKLNVDFMSRVM